VDKTFEVEVVRMLGASATYATIRIARTKSAVNLSVNSDPLYLGLTVDPAEAVTIGEQLIAAGKAEG
jgi:hypothetical protein